MAKNLPANAGDSGSGRRTKWHCLEKEMATHSSIVACEILWTEEPGGLYSLWGNKRVGQDLESKQQEK